MVIDDELVQIKFAAYHGVGAVIIDALALGVQLVGGYGIQLTRVAVVILLALVSIVRNKL